MVTTHTLKEGPWLSAESRVLPRTSTGEVPDVVYRLMDRRQLQEAQDSGSLEPAPGTDMIWASGEPVFYSQSDPTKPIVLVGIEYSDDDGWSASVSSTGDVYARTRRPVPISKVSVVSEGENFGELLQAWRQKVAQGLKETYEFPVYDASHETWEKVQNESGGGSLIRVIERPEEGWSEFMLSGIEDYPGDPNEIPFMVGHKIGKSSNFKLSYGRPGQTVEEVKKDFVQDLIAKGHYMPPRLSETPEWASDEADSFPPVPLTDIALEDTPGFYREKKYGKAVLDKELEGSPLARHLVKRAGIEDRLNLGADNFAPNIETVSKSEFLTDMWAPGEEALETVRRKAGKKVSEKQIQTARDVFARATQKSLDRRGVFDSGGWRGNKAYVFRGGDPKGSPETPTAVSLNPMWAAEFARASDGNLRMYEVERKDVLLDADAVIWGDKSRDPYTGAMQDGEWQHEEDELIVRIKDLKNPRRIVLPYTDQYRREGKALELIKKNPDRFVTDPGAPRDAASPSGGLDQVEGNKGIKLLIEGEDYEPGEAEGHCYAMAVHAARKNRDVRPVVVHGRNPKLLQGGHAWLEFGDTVYDPTARVTNRLTGETQIGEVTTKEDWYEKQGFIPNERYEYMDLLETLLREGHYGPFDESEYAEDYSPGGGLDVVKQPIHEGGKPTQENMDTSTANKEAWGWSCPPPPDKPTLDQMRALAECQAIHNLAINKYSNFGYHASKLINYNHLLPGLGRPKPGTNVFKPLVDEARRLKIARGAEHYEQLYQEGETHNQGSPDLSPAGGLDKVAKKGKKSAKKKLGPSLRESRALREKEGAQEAARMKAIEKRLKLGPGGKVLPGSDYIERGRPEEYIQSEERYQVRQPDGTIETLSVEHYKLIRPTKTKFMRREYGVSVVPASKPLFDTKTLQPSKPLKEYWTISQSFHGGPGAEGDALGGFSSGGHYRHYDKKSITDAKKKIKKLGFKQQKLSPQGGWSHLDDASPSGGLDQVERKGGTDAVHQYAELYESFVEDHPEGGKFGHDFTTNRDDTRVREMRQLVADNPDQFGPQYDKAFRINRKDSPLGRGSYTPGPDAENWRRDNLSPSGGLDQVEPGNSPGEDFKVDTKDAEWVSPAATAKAIKKELKAKYPDTKFSVKSSTFSGGSAVDVRYEGGPAWSEINDLLGDYQGGRFDSMIDLQTTAYSWLLPDGSAVLAKIEGTGGSMGVIPDCDAPKPHPDAKLVKFSPGYVMAHRSPSSKPPRDPSTLPEGETMGLGEIGDWIVQEGVKHNPERFTDQWGDSKGVHQFETEFLGAWQRSVGTEPETSSTGAPEYPAKDVASVIATNFRLPMKGTINSDASPSGGLDEVDPGNRGSLFHREVERKDQRITVAGGREGTVVDVYVSPDGVNKNMLVMTDDGGGFVSIVGMTTEKEPLGTYYPDFEKALESHNKVRIAEGMGHEIGGSRAQHLQKRRAEGNPRISTGDLVEELISDAPLGSERSKQQRKLVDYYHAGRGMGKNRHEALIYASQHFSKEHPEFRRLAAYKAVDYLVRPSHPVDAMPADAPALFEPSTKHLRGHYPKPGSKPTPTKVKAPGKPKQPVWTNPSGKVKSYRDTKTGNKFSRRSSGRKPRGSRFVKA